jgi:hypothetical protein
LKKLADQVFYQCLIGLFLLFASACQSHEQVESTEPVKKVIYDEAPEDFKISKSVWDVLDSNETLTGEIPDPENIFLPAALTLKQKNQEVLKSPEVEFEFGRGGGKLDLAQWMGNEPGTFYLKFNLSIFEQYPTLRVYYLSQARKRKIDDETFGVGCNKLIEITSAFKKSMQQKGLELNTTRARHASVSAGHYFFVARAGKKKYITQVEITDSTQSHLLCGSAKEI